VAKGRGKVLEKGGDGGQDVQRCVLGVVPFGERNVSLPRSPTNNEKGSRKGAAQI